MPTDVIDWARWLGFAAMLLTLLLLIYIALLRLWLALMERRNQRFRLLWRPWCINASCGLAPSTLPAYLSERNWLLFFRLWQHYLLNVHGEARDNLRRLGRSLGLHHIVIKILNRTAAKRQLIAAIAAAGWLRDMRAWELLLQHLRDPDSVLSFSAARSLTRIDARSALREVIPLIVSRPDWSKHLVAGLLLEVGPSLVSAPLLHVLLSLPQEQVGTLLGYLPFADVSTSNVVLYRYLFSEQDQELLCACLKAARSPKVLPLVRDRLADSHWSVRVEAANALSRLGDSNDIARLQPLLADQEWWVRYRAAQAIGELLHRDKAQMRLINQAQTDRYATDMLNQVMAEWEST